MGVNVKTEVNEFDLPVFAVEINLRLYEGECMACDPHQHLDLNKTSFCKGDSICLAFCL